MLQRPRHAKARSVKPGIGGGLGVGLDYANSSTHSDLLQHAFEYIWRGWPVVPARRNKPIVQWTPLKTALPTDDDVASWPWRHADGLALVISDALYESLGYIYVLDIERHHRGDAERWLNRNIPGWGRGRIAESGSQGLHVYCQTSRPVSTTKCEWGDIKGHDSLAFIPPTRSAKTGNEYRWLSQGRLIQLEPEAIPHVTSRTRTVWNGKRADDSQFDPAQLEPILNGCAWLRNVWENAAAFGEPTWYAALSIIGRCEDGAGLAHEFSAKHPNYRPQDCDKKLAHALESAGPRTCENICTELGGAPFCDQCIYRELNLIKSPISLGQSETWKPTVVRVDARGPEECDE